MMRRWALALLLAIAVATPVAASPDVSQLFLTPGGDDLEYELKALNANGSLYKVSGHSAVGRPALSPDGRRIAFSGYRGQGDDGRYPLYLMNTDGSGLVRMTDPFGADMDPAWSPNGKLIAFSRDIDGGFSPASCCHLKLLNVAGGGVNGVPHTKGAVNPAWSPDGKKLVFETPNGLFTINKDGSKKDKVAGAGSGQPVWAPSGEKIAYVLRVSQNPPVDRLKVVKVGNESKTVLYKPGSRIESPHYDGNAIEMLTFDGYGYSDRSGARIRRRKPNGDVVTVFSGQGHAVFLGTVSSRCYGMERKGGHDGGAGIEGKDASGDCYGAALATGDFDRDGVADLATGVPGEMGSGAVGVTYGVAGTGLTSGGDDRFTQGSSGIADKNNGDDRFGEALAVGDFNGDGFDDLAIGVPGEDAGAKEDAGAVAVLFGSSSGVVTIGDQRFTQDSPGVVNRREADDRFGEALAVGDFDNDGFDDLAIGVPGEDLTSQTDAGAVAILYGRSSGLSADGGHDWFHQDLDGITNKVEGDDRFGEALAVGDFDDDGFDDLAVGVPGEDLSSHTDAGATAVFYGGAVGVKKAGDDWFHQDSSGVGNKVEVDDRFGGALAVGDFDDDGFDDLAVGVPGEDLSGRTDVGGFNVLEGASNGLRSSNLGLMSELAPGIGGGGQTDDRYAAALVAGDFDDDGHADVGSGIPGEDIGPFVDSGVVSVVYGAPGLLTGTGDQRFSQG